MEPLILIQCLYNNSKNKKKNGRPKPVLKKDMRVEYIPVDGNRWIAAKLINRAGKGTGKYSSCWNIHTIHKGESEVLVFDRDVQKWRELTSILSDDDCSSEEQGVENLAEVESTAETVNVCQVLSSQIDSEVTRAKQLELQNWAREDVYDEVIDQGQRHISVRRVVTTKLENKGKISCEALRRPRTISGLIHQHA